MIRVSRSKDMKGKKKKKEIMAALWLMLIVIGDYHTNIAFVR